MKKPAFSNCVRKLRFDHDEMTQETLAKLVGCTRQTIVALEQSRYVPSLALAYKIARTFGVRVEEVFRFHEDENE